MVNSLDNIPEANKAVLLNAVQFLGVKEIDGTESNETILDFWKTLQIDWAVNDSFAWCAAAHNAILKISKCNYFETGLARKTLELKSKIEPDNAIIGDSVVFNRGTNSTFGHVGIFLRFEIIGSEKYIVCLGGNQSDEFKASKYHISRLVGFRRPTFIN